MITKVLPLNVPDAHVQALFDGFLKRLMEARSREEMLSVLDDSFNKADVMWDISSIIPKITFQEVGARFIIRGERSMTLAINSPTEHGTPPQLSFIGLGAPSDKISAERNPECLVLILMALRSITCIEWEIIYMEGANDKVFPDGALFILPCTERHARIPPMIAVRDLVCSPMEVTRVGLPNEREWHVSWG